MFSLPLLFTLCLTAVSAFVLPRTTTPIDNTTILPIHNITRIPGTKFENLALRPNGQILTTTTLPNASIYQIDPLNILPPVLIHTIPGEKITATGIAEGKFERYYVASGHSNITNPFVTYPDSYLITEIDMRGVEVLPGGTLKRELKTRVVARLPNAALLNGVAFARPGSEHLLVADSFKGLIWNVNVCTGEVGVTLNDTTTKGVLDAKGPTFTGINGIKVHNGTVYYTSTGTSSLFSVPIDEEGNVLPGQKPTLVTSDISCDDLVLDHQGNAYVAGPANIITKVSPDGQKEIISTGLIGPTALKFGRLGSDRWSLYVTTNGGLSLAPSDATGVSRIDLGYRA